MLSRAVTPPATHNQKTKATAKLLLLLTLTSLPNLRLLIVVLPVALLTLRLNIMASLPSSGRAHMIGPVPGMWGPQGQAACSWLQCKRPGLCRTAGTHSFKFTDNLKVWQPGLQCAAPWAWQACLLIYIFELEHLIFAVLLKGPKSVCCALGRRAESVAVAVRPVEGEGAMKLRCRRSGFTFLPHL